MMSLDVLSNAFQGIVGVPFDELAEAHGFRWADSPRNNKRLAAQIVRKSVELDEGAMLPWLVRTVGIGAGLKVLEHAQVARLDYEETYAKTFEASGLARRLETVVLVPIMKYAEDPRHWYVRAPIVWVTTADQRSQFEQDYSAARALVRDAQHDQLSSAEPPSGQGRYLISNTRGEDGEDRREVKLGSKTVQAKPRGWYLRKSLVQRTIDESMRFRLGVNGRSTQGTSLEDFVDEL